MPIKIVTCQCGSTEQLARRLLQRAGYEGWMTIPVIKGKEKSRSVAQSLAGYPEAQMLDNYLKDASKWVVIIGWNENGCRWSDIAHHAPRSEVDAKLIVETFA